MIDDLNQINSSYNQLIEFINDKENYSIMNDWIINPY